MQAERGEYAQIIARHQRAVYAVVLAAGMYADVPDFADQVTSACESGAWSPGFRQCFAAAQSTGELHACLQPVGQN